jgi:hypothetical protein
MCKLMSKSPYTTSEINLMYKVTDYENMDTVYTIFSKTTDNENIPHFTLLKKAFRTRNSACEYAISKITTMLNEINNDYKQNDERRILPIHATLIYTLYNMKGDDVEKYEYFLAEYKKFFHGISFPETMFFVSEHKLI